MIAIGSDHGGFMLKESIKKHLDERSTEYIDCGCFSSESCDYPLIAKAVCEKITSGECTSALLFCGTGVGMSIAANKIDTIRACVCSDSFSARYCRLHNNANVLCLGARVIGEGLAAELVDIFLDTGFEGGRHQRRVSEISDIEAARNQSAV